MALRKPTDAENSLIAFLLTLGEAVPAAEVDRHSLVVENMNDGGMGSLRLVPNGARAAQRFFGHRVSSWESEDEDGVKLLVSLVIDSNGRLYELEIFKTDFSRLKRFPVAAG
jgi:hypothetical protein